MLKYRNVHSSSYEPLFSRRIFLYGSAGIGAGALAVMCGLAPALRPSRAWAAEMPKRGQVPALQNNTRRHCRTQKYG